MKTVITSYIHYMQFLKNVNRKGKSLEWKTRPLKNTFVGEPQTKIDKEKIKKYLK